MPVCLSLRPSVCLSLVTIQFKMLTVISLSIRYKANPDLNNRFENSLDSLIYITYFFIEYIKHLKENTLDSF